MRDFPDGKMKAVFQGEFHISSTDRKSLDSHLQSNPDALFIERRKDRVSPENWSLGYLCFLIGVLSLYWFQAFIYSGPNIEEKADVPIHEDIDTDLPVLYPRFPTTWVLGLGIFSSLVVAAGLFVPVFPIPFIHAPATATLIFTAGIKPILVIAASLLFSFFLIILEERRLGSRDKDMAEAIDRISSENGYEMVVVSCGDAHLDRLPDLLEEKGWETTTHESKHSWAAKAWRW